MSSTAILWGIIPLLLFVIIDSLVGPKAALFTVVLAAMAEAILSIYLFGELDLVTGFSFFLVLLLAATSYKYRNPIYVKLQPVILGVGMGVALVTSYLVQSPLLLVMAEKYRELLPPLQMQLNNPIMVKVFEVSTLTIGLSLIVHAGIVAYAAYRLSNWWWLIIRGIGVYLFMIIGIFASYPFVLVN